MDLFIYIIYWTLNIKSCLLIAHRISFSNKKQLRKERALAEGLDWDSDEYDKDPEALKEKYKSMVTYEKGGERFKKGKADNRGLGPGHES